MFTGVLFPFQLSGVLRTATGKPGEVICKVAEEEQAAMIVTGMRGMGKVGGKVHVTWCT